MNRPAAAIPALFALAFALPALAAAPSQGAAPTEAVPAPARVEATAPDTFVYGPILAEDPEARVQIKQLYREQRDLELAVSERISELNDAVASEPDPDLRLQLERDAMELKEAHRIQVAEIGLEIARLNGDDRRAAEYELALDQMRHPERYMPPTKDPAVAARERARDAGLE